MTTVNDYISVDPSKRLGSTLRNFIDTLRTLENQLGTLKDGIEHRTDGITWTAVETDFGLPPGQGSNTYTLLSNAYVKLSDSAVLALLARLS
jgi:hypothetical protein